MREEADVEHKYSRRVEFLLFPDHLEVTHFGIPFDEEDVRAICSIKRGTKHLTDIGRFGIGFKSVYAYTKSPEVHSGDEHFVIESYVHPRATCVRTTRPGETLFHIPFDHEEIRAEQAYEEIGARLARLKFRTLLFLRQIESVRWELDGKAGGRYLRRCKQKDEHTEVTLVGRSASDDPATPLDKQHWIVFSRPVTTPKGESAGQVEIAFQLALGWEDNIRLSGQSIYVYPVPVTLHPEGTAKHFLDF